MTSPAKSNHIPGTDDGAALGPVRVGVVELTVRKFQPFLAIGEMRAALLRLPSNVLAEIREADDLLVANEDIVFNFVAARLEVPGESPETAPRGSIVLWLRHGSPCHRVVVCAIGYPFATVLFFLLRPCLVACLNNSWISLSIDQMFYVNVNNRCLLFQLIERSLCMLSVAILSA